MLIRTLGQASVGRVNPSEVLLVMGFTVLGHLPTILTLSLFVAITATLTRMYAASEMVVWFSSGQGLLAFLKPVLRFAWPVLLAVAVLALLVWPWSNQQIRELRDRYQSRGDIERVTPGRFIESAGGQRVFFIDKDTADGTEGRNVFISSVERDGSESITSARSGRVEWIDGVQYLMLENGQRLEQPPPGSPGDAALKVSEFALYGIQIGGGSAAASAGGGLKSVPTQQLIASPNRAYLGELGWRIGMGLTAINFVLLALAVSAGNPRAGKSGNLIFMLLAFVFYYNLLNLGQSWVATGLVGLWPFMLALHGGVFTVSLLWLAQRHYQFAWWPRRRSVVGGAA